MNTNSEWIWGNHVFSNIGGRVWYERGLLPTDPHWDDFQWVQAHHTSERDIKKSSNWNARLGYKRAVTEELLSEAGKFTSETPLCLITHGGIAAGKTSVVDGLLKDELYDLGEVFRIDLDLMKQRLPEFIFMTAKKLKLAATYTQTESAMWAHHLFKKCIQKRMNIIFEGSNRDITVLTQKIGDMRKAGYKIAVAAVHTPLSDCLKRAETRFLDGGRYVPPNVIKNSCEKCPASLPTLKSLVDYIYLFDNGGDTALRVCKAVKGEALTIFDSDLMARYEKAVGAVGSLKD